MSIRPKTLWRVPVYLLASGWLSWYITIYLGGFFYTVQTPMADGSISLSTDPVRTLVFHGVLLGAILAGGWYLFRNLSRKELAVSAAIASALFLGVVLAQMFVPNFPLSLSVTLAKYQNWTVFPSDLIYRLTKNMNLSVILPNFVPFIFVLFGKKQES